MPNFQFSKRAKWPWRDKILGAPQRGQKIIVNQSKPILVIVSIKPFTRQSFRQNYFSSEIEWRVLLRQPLKSFLCPQKETNFHMSHVKSKLPYMCSRTVLGEIKNLQSQKIPFRLRRRFEQRFCKACHIIFFAVAMLVLLNENRSCR